MYGLYVNDNFTGVYDLKTVRSMGFILAAKGHKVSYRHLN